MTPGQKAEARIADLGISDPRDLDVEAIASDAGVAIEYRQLTGCDATLVGFGSRAIATIKRSHSRGRERFSIGHELGHWELHRGRSFQCRVENPSENLASDAGLEKEADTYASHLLMPGSLFSPVIKPLGTPGFCQIGEVSELFQTSLLATTIRLAHVNKLPVIVACYTLQKRRWHIRALDVPARWWLRSALDNDSFAYELLTTGKTYPAPRKQPGEVWFENDDAEKFEILEHCHPMANGEVLVLLYLTDFEMLEAGFDPNVGRRKYATARKANRV
ncbi:ImmA/IrrE family metallo-endopeptidase [Sulfuricaulis sp.]|uniref:ImmA/IrrE family metallo-endopeptidase n=1 Tax=Sulfuricaulis sp. TaxID=2003553 RepID=UPI00355A7507